jgi:membrane protein implicated in regulation of membrane protease activity
MVMFAGLAVVAVGFVRRYLPETKGQSVEEITRTFEAQARDRRAGLGPRGRPVQA